MNKGMDKINNIKFVNSTFSNISLGKSSVFDLSKAKSSTTIDINACTFYNVVGADGYFINAKMQNKELKLR